MGEPRKIASLHRFPLKLICTPDFSAFAFLAACVMTNLAKASLTTMNAPKTYDDYWKSGLHQTREWSSEQFDEYLGPVVGRNRVLDYGCGMGFSYQRQLVASVGEYCGADVSDVAIEETTRKGLGALKIRDDSTIDVPEASFDGAVCSEVMEHLYDPLAAAKELFRVLKPGGTLVMTVPHFGYFAWRLRVLLLARVWDEPESPENPFKGVHIRYYSMRHARNLLKYAGFQKISVHRFDRCNIWHLGHVFGTLGRPLLLLGECLPRYAQMQFLDGIWPQLFAQRIRLVASK